MIERLSIRFLKSIIRVIQIMKISIEYSIFIFFFFEVWNTKHEGKNKNMNEKVHKHYNKSAIILKSTIMDGCFEIIFFHFVPNKNYFAYLLSWVKCMDKEIVKYCLWIVEYFICGFIFLLKLNTIFFGRVLSLIDIFLFHFK